MCSTPLLIATRNPGKLRELSELLAGVPFELVSLAEASIEEDVEETGSTLEENASLKATAYAQLSGLPALADDSGLEVEALGGEPGPLSSRYAGEGASDAHRIAFLLRKLENIPQNKWKARFRCVIAIAWPLRQALRSDGPWGQTPAGRRARRYPTKGVGQGRLSKPVELHTGECRGRITDQPRGSFGFGYDPVFLLPELGKTMAELSPEEKNRISHRSVAARKAAAALKREATSLGVLGPTD